MHTIPPCDLQEKNWVECIQLPKIYLTAKTIKDSTVSQVISNAA